jgi:hypothetical protein
MTTYGTYRLLKPAHGGALRIAAARSNVLFNTSILALIALAVAVLLGVLGVLGPEPATLDIFLEPAEWYWWIGPLAIGALGIGMVALRHTDEYVAWLYGPSLASLAPTTAFVLWMAAVYAWFKDESHIAAAVLLWLAWVPACWHVGDIGEIATPHLWAYVFYCLPFVAATIWFEFAAGYAVAAALGGSSPTWWAVAGLWFKVVTTTVWACYRSSPEISLFYVITFMGVLIGYASSDARHDVGDSVGVPLLAGGIIHSLTLYYYTYARAYNWAQERRTHTV